MKTRTPVLDPPAPEQLDQQRDHDIDAAVRSGNVTRQVARDICQTMRLRPGSTLAHFAETGHLDAECALAELEYRHSPTDHIPWISALWDYLERLVEIQRREQLWDSANPLAEVT